jgi:hypothetical protein
LDASPPSYGSGTGGEERAEKTVIQERTEKNEDHDVDGDGFVAIAL